MKIPILITVCLLSSCDFQSTERNEISEFELYEYDFDGIRYSLIKTELSVDSLSDGWVFLEKDKQKGLIKVGENTFVLGSEEFTVSKFLYNYDKADSKMLVFWNKELGVLLHKSVTWKTFSIPASGKSRLLAQLIMNEHEFFFDHPTEEDLPSDLEVDLGN